MYHRIIYIIYRIKSYIITYIVSYIISYHIYHISCIIYIIYHIIQTDGGIRGMHWSSCPTAGPSGCHID